MPLNQYGLSLLNLVFVILFIGLALAALSVQLISSSQASSQALMATRGQWAAISGLEWAQAQVMSQQSCANLPSQFELQGFNVQVQCQLRVYEQGQRLLFDLQSTASLGQPGSPDYIWQAQQSLIELEGPL